MPGNKGKPARIFSWIVTACRVLVGMLVVKTGVDLARGASRFYGQEYDNFITGLFAVLVGAYFILSSLFRKFFGDE